MANWLFQAEGGLPQCSIPLPADDSSSHSINTVTQAGTVRVNKVSLAMPWLYRVTGKALINSRTSNFVNAVSLAVYPDLPEKSLTLDNVLDWKFCTEKHTWNESAVPGTNHQRMGQIYRVCRMEGR